MLPKLWHSFSLLLLVNSVLGSDAGSLFENVNIVRTAELGGSVVHVTTTYAITPLKDGLKTYTIALGREEKEVTSWLEVRLKGQNKALPVTEQPLDSNKNFHLIDVQLPQGTSVDKPLNLILEAVQTHATYPWPATAAQNEEQALKYTTDLFVLSPYATASQSTKLKALNPRIIGFTEPRDVEHFVKQDAVKQSGASVMYGSYKDLPPSTLTTFIKKYQQPITIHYYHDQPVLEITKLERSAEISHWGANLNIEDKMVLYNAGPKLKGHFSRFEHQTQAFYKRAAPHVLPALNLHLPAGIRNTYYYDIIGNVSTSKLRVAPSVPKNKQGTSFSLLEFRPRYPLLGGWNYSFTLGWDSPLEDSASYDRKTDRYIVEIPIWTPITGAVVNEEELNVILPEGATDVQFATPFPALSNSLGTHVTYLDTTGRPILTFKYKDLTVKHAESIFVSYKVSWSAHLKKPLSVGTAFLGLFTLAMIARRVNLTLHQQKKKTS